MKMLRILLISAAFSTSVMASGITTSNLDNFDKLTESQKATIVSNVEQLARNNKEVVQTPAAEKLDKWVDVGTKLGKGLAGAAKETNIAVNDFARTPVGILTTALLVWHFMGAALVHIFVGIFVLVTGVIVIGHTAKRIRSQKTTVQDQWTGPKSNVTVLEPLNVNQIIGLSIAYGLLLIASLITVFSF